MAKLKKEAWKDDGWERGNKIPGGNQGYTFLARRSTDPPESFNYVLKTLKRQDEIDRRAMFCAEIRAMGVLDHSGVIRVEGTNAERFREDVELYLITPRITGCDLETLAQSQSLSLEDAVRVTTGVLGILDHCHRRGVLHRDIKPCHVILRGNSIDDPVLIDFGLAYHRDTQPSDAATEPGQGKGNRFLIGPEHLTHNPDANRNPATDICQCLGMLFYAITKKYPGALRDEKNGKPHERFSLTTLRPDLVEWKRNALLQILDVGFEWEPTHRWQTIDRLVSHLVRLLEEDLPSDRVFRLELADVVRRARSSSHTLKFQKASEIAQRLVELVKSVVPALSAETEEFITVKCSPAGGHGQRLASMCISFQNKVDPTRSKAISFVVELSDAGRIDVSLAPYTGNLRIFPNSKAVSLSSFDPGFAEYRDDVRDRLLPLLSEVVAEVIGVD